MDTSKVKAALDSAQKELNTLTDAEFAARRQPGLRALTLASSAIGLATKHLTDAAARVTPKAPAAQAAPAGANK